jgi:hypothetical protein
MAQPASAVFFWGTKSLGMGTASVGLADDNNAVEINPAGIAQGNQYSIDLVYERWEYQIWDYPHWHPEDTEPVEDENDFSQEYFTDDEDTTIAEDEKEMLDVWRVSVVDSSTVPNFSMGLYFTGVDFPNEAVEENKGYHFGLCLASNFGDLVYVGANPKFMQLTKDDSMFNADFGVLISIMDIIGIGLAGHNVFQADIENRINRDIALGLAGHVLDYAQIDFDVTKDFDSESDNTWNFALGTQGIVLGGLTLRGGFNWNQIDDRALYGLGIGWTDIAQGTLAYSFQGDVEQVKNYKHSININIRF